MAVIKFVLSVAKTIFKIDHHRVLVGLILHLAKDMFEKHDEELTLELKMQLFKYLCDAIKGNKNDK